MIIADPFGSWVQGAHEGINDSLAMRAGADSAMKNAYGLARSAQFDPLEFAAAQRKNKFEQQIDAEGLPMRSARAQTANEEMKGPESYANYGMYYPLLKQLQNAYPGTGLDPHGNIVNPMQVGQDTLNYHTNPNRVESPNQLHYGAMAGYDAARINQGEQRIMQGQERIDRQGSSVAPNGEFPIFSPNFNPNRQPPNPAPNNPSTNYYNTQ